MKTHENISCELNNSSKKKGGETMENLNVNFTKTFKNFFIVVFSMIAFALLSHGYIAHAAIEKSGMCSVDVHWNLYNGNLTIIGSSAGREMPDYFAYENGYANTPWYKYKDEITIVRVQNVKYVGCNAFYGCNKLETVNLYQVEEIGSNAFAKCDSLKEITLTESLYSKLDYSELVKIGIKNFSKITFTTGKSNSTESTNNLKSNRPNTSRNTAEDINPTNYTSEPNKTNIDKNNTEKNDAASASAINNLSESDKSETAAKNTSSSETYFSKTADIIMPQTLFALAALLMLSLAGLWVSLRKQKA